ADIFVRSVQGTVQYLHFRMVDRRFQARFLKFRSGSEDDLTAVADGFFYGFQGGVGCYVVIGFGLQPVVEFIVEIEPAQFVTIGPAGSFRRLGMDKADGIMFAFLGGSKQTVE